MVTSFRGDLRALPPTNTCSSTLVKIAAAVGSTVNFITRTAIAINLILRISRSVGEQPAAFDAEPCRVVSPNQGMRTPDILAGAGLNGN